jgi:hypothetical protein
MIPQRRKSISPARMGAEGLGPLEVDDELEFDRASTGRSAGASRASAKPLAGCRSFAFMG